MMRDTRGNFPFLGITQRHNEWALFLTRENVLLVISNCNISSIVFISLLFEKTIFKSSIESRPFENYFPCISPREILLFPK